MNDEKDLEIVMGDNSFLEFSDVGDCVNSLRPKNKNKPSKKVIIPKTKQEKEDENKK